jgi:hypothetical protein
VAASFFLCGLLWLTQATGQQPVNNLRNTFAPGGNQQNGTLLGPNGMNNATVGPGGGANADFDSLIELITTTIEPTMWVDGGGAGDIRPFASGGVLVDTAGMLRLKSNAAAKQAGGELAARRGTAPPAVLSGGDARKSSPLRCVSLPRLEAEIVRRQAARQPLDISMLTLAGLRRVQYVFVYPETGDLVLAGPAGDWRLDADARIVAADTGQPVVRLDDLLVLLRRSTAGDSYFGCSIDPRQEALAQTQSYLDQTSRQPLQPGQRKDWLAKLRDSMGKQDIKIFGVDPASRVAGVLVEADYHMKLIGMGLADGVEGVESYLDSIEVKNGEVPPAMSVLRWWFTLNYETIRAAASGDAFELVGQGVGVLSENELLAAQGQRVHTGQSDPLNKLFADRFTTHFVALAEKYPVYADLRNLFDLAVAAALIQSDGLVARANWKPTRLFDAEKLPLPKQAVPRQVETVINHRVINRRHVVAGVSGGVMVEAKNVLKAQRASDTSGMLAKERRTAPSAVNATVGAWWWDVAE